MSFEFLLTALIVVLIPGSGVIYTVSTGLFQGARFSLAAAIGCTFGIIPHLLASVFGLAALLHASALAFEMVKYIGVAYLLYLAYGMWRDTGSLSLSEPKESSGYLQVGLRGTFINILNPKLSIFFLAFLPQFISEQAASPMAEMLKLSLTFMGLTLVVFVVYGLGANSVRRFVVGNDRLVKRLQRSFAGVFVALGAKLAFEDR